MMRPHEKDGRRKKWWKKWQNGNRTLEEQNEQVLEEHRKAKNLQSEEEDPGLEVVEENHREGKDEQGTGRGTKENLK